MGIYELISIFASKLTTEQIEALTDDEVLSVRTERPNHPGQFGLMLNPKYFQSSEHLSKILYALLRRLQKVQKY